MNERAAPAGSIDTRFVGAALRIATRERWLPLDEFLIYCANALIQRNGPSPRDEELDDLCEAFLRAGLSACATGSSASTWVQAGLAIEDERWSPTLYRELAAMARMFLDAPAVRNVFFMHKPPGMRLRLEVSEPQHEEVEEDLHQRLTALQADGVVARIVPGVYEPETHLFGGPVSMESVHRLFTIDSLAWLDFHSLTAAEGRDEGSRWVVSLLMLRQLFTELGITDWEDLDVWNRIRIKTGRRLPTETLRQRDFVVAATELQAAWMDLRPCFDTLPSHMQAIVQDHHTRIAEVVSTWIRDYFSVRGASIGPREAAAFVTIFHWNRAGLSLTRQALITEALAARERV